MNGLMYKVLKVNTTVKPTFGMKNKCCVNVKVYVEIVFVCGHVCIHVRVQPYLPFPPTRTVMLWSKGSASIIIVFLLLVKC